MEDLEDKKIRRKRLRRGEVERKKKKMWRGRKEIEKERVLA